MGTLEHKSFAKEINENKLFYTLDSNWYVRYNNQEEYYESGRACYGEINYIAKENELGIDELVVFHPNHSFCEEVAVYILQSEFFNDCFLTKTLEEGFNSGFSMNLTKPYPMVLGAMIALRSAWYADNNKYKNDSLYEEFRRVGATILEALFLSEWFYIVDNKIYLSNYKGDHHIFPIEIPFSELKSLTFGAKGPAANEVGYLQCKSFWDYWNFVHIASLFSAHHRLFQNMGAKSLSRYDSISVPNTKENVKEIYDLVKGL